MAKSASKKKVSKKKVAKKKTTTKKKTTVKKKVASKKTQPAKSKKPARSAKTSVTPAQRNAMIAEAAYYRWEQSGYIGEFEMEHWLLAEQDIDNQLRE